MSAAVLFARTVIERNNMPDRGWDFRQCYEPLVFAFFLPLGICIATGQVFGGCVTAATLVFLCLALARGQR
jgi:hypothetical protein